MGEAHCYKKSRGRQILNVVGATKSKTLTSVQAVEIYSNPGVVTVYELSDNFKNPIVWLIGGSRLRYPVVFNDKTRGVEMRVYKDS